MLGQYDEAIGEYDRALQVRPGLAGALVNREIARARAARLKATGGNIDDTEPGATQIVFDKTKKGGRNRPSKGLNPNDR